MQHRHRPREQHRSSLAPRAATRLVSFRTFSGMRGWPKSVRFDEKPVAVLLPEPRASEVRGLLAEGKRVDAVALVRQRTHLDLLPAVLAVDATRDAAT